MAGNWSRLDEESWNFRPLMMRLRHTTVVEPAFRDPEKLCKIRFFVFSNIIFIPSLNVNFDESKANWYRKSKIASQTICRFPTQLIFFYYILNGTFILRFTQPLVLGCLKKDCIGIGALNLLSHEILPLPN